MNHNYAYLCTPSNDWTEGAFAIAPTGATLSRLTIWLRATGQGTAEFEDFRFYRTHQATPVHQLQNDFEGKIRLIGYDLASDKGSMDGSTAMTVAGDSLQVTPFWQA